MLKDYLKSLGFELLHESQNFVEWQKGELDDVNRITLQFINNKSWWVMWYVYDYDDNSEEFYEQFFHSFRYALDFIKSFE
jgi:hypothetical protein